MCVGNGKESRGGLKAHALRNLAPISIIPRSINKGIHLAYWAGKLAEFVHDVNAVYHSNWFCESHWPTKGPKRDEKDRQWS